MNKFKEIVLLSKLSGVAKATIHKDYFEVLKEVNDVDELIDILEHKFSFSNKVLNMAKEDSEELYDSIINSDIHVITEFDDDYPKKLNSIGNQRPLILYVKGNVEALTKSNVAIIGTRKPSKSSEIFEENLVKSILNSSDRVVVSGLALGCDKIAHQTTVDEKGTTVAVLPSGVNVIKPAKHKKLAEEILETGGCLVSEYEPDAKVNRGSYVERDKIVAALSDAIFVVECDVDSGTMHTVKFADEYETQIFSYLPTERPENSYCGNIEILNQYEGSVKVEYIEDFITELEFINTHKKSINPKGDFQSKLF